MAIHPRMRPQGSQGHLSPQQALAISAWSEQQAAAALQDMTLSDSAPAMRIPSSPTPIRSGLHGATVSLSIPLDDEVTPKVESRPPTVSFRRRAPLRRDGLKSREALLKGKDGSRRRQRWENDRLLHNPWAEPPSSKDWDVQPTYPRHDPMPYYLAPLWDVHYSHVADHQSAMKAAERANEKHHIPKELRVKLKHARASRGMLQDLEEEVRTFIQKWNEKELLLENEGLQDAPENSTSDESEDEIVFVGRNGQMHDSPERKERLRLLREEISTHSERDGEKMVLETLVNDRAAGFSRWLVHSIASYYGLHTWSVTVEDRREAYVGFRPPAPGSRAGLVSHPAHHSEALIKPGEELPRPLYAQI
ncbi:Single-stranded nucleic acid binding R3H [Penicillium sp. IBT 31633x]|nr:Single-stranded nucleic acid binding R3H [Penicillium sp. IBT 31633x]